MELTGSYPRAWELYSQGLEVATALGDLWFSALGFTCLIGLARFIHNLARAEHAWQEALRLANETGVTFITLEALVGLASLQARQGETESALEWLLLVMSHPACLQETRQRAAPLCRDLETQLAGQQMEAARDRVQAKTLEAVVDEALE